MLQASPTNGMTPSPRSIVKSALPSPSSPSLSRSAPASRQNTLSMYPAVAAFLSSPAPRLSLHSSPTAAAPATARPVQQRSRPLPPRSLLPEPSPAAAAATDAAPLPVPSSPPGPPLPRRPSFSSFTLLSALRSLNVAAVQWLLHRGASLAAEEAQEGCQLLELVWEMVRDDRLQGADDEDELEEGSESRSGAAAPPRMRRSVSSKPAASTSHSQSHDDGTDLKRPTLDRRKSTPLPANYNRQSAPLPSSASAYLALSPLASVRVYTAPLPFSSTLCSLLLLLMPHSASLQLPALPSAPPPSLSTLLSFTAFCSHLHPLLLTLHSNTASLALTHAHILVDIDHTLTALAAQQEREQNDEERKDGTDGLSANQRLIAAQVRWRQKKEQLVRERKDRDREAMEYVRQRAADVQQEAAWAAERVEQQLRSVASEERRLAESAKEQRRLQRRIDSMERRYAETRRLSAESSRRCRLLAEQSAAFSSQLSLVAAALSAERSKSTQDEIDLVAVRLSQQQHCMLLFRPRANLFRKPLLRDWHPQLRLVLPAPSLCLQASELLRHTQRPSWAEWSVQVSAVGGTSSRWRLEVWDVDEGRREERVCGCWSSVSEVLLSAGEDVELQLLSGDTAEDGEHVGMLWLSQVRMAYI